MYQVPEKVPGPAVGKFLCQLRGLKGLNRLRQVKKCVQIKSAWGWIWMSLGVQYNIYDLSDRFL